MMGGHLLWHAYVQTEFDTDKNDRLSSAEIAAVKEIIAYAKGIKNLKGIEFFTALETLNCVQCELTELDVSKNTELTSLSCWKNELTELDVSQNSKLERLYCRNNMLAVLDVSKNSKLNSISCGKNGLTSLDLDQNEKIEYVNLNDYQFYNKGTLPAGETFDLKTLPGSFDPKRATDWQGGTVNETTGILTVDANAEAVTYKYKTKSDSTEAKYLMPCKMQVRAGTTPPTTYTVSFDANGGIGTMADVTGVTGSYTLPTCTFTAPSGKQFKGWATSASGTVITGTSITVSADTTLYAIWEPISVTTYTVSFDANGGTGTMADVTGVTGSYTLPTCTFTAPSGKQFKGWATSASGTVITGTSITVSADTTLYAIWEPIPVSKPAITTATLPDGKVGDAYSQTLAATGTNPITWNVETGALPDGLTLVGDTIKGTPSKAGDFKFTVKATNGGGSDTKELTIKIADADSAKYHNVTLSGAGTGATGAGSHAAGTTVNIYAGTKSGYTFNGWTSDDVTVLSASSKNASFVMPDKAVTVKANWVYTGGGGGSGYSYYTIEATAGAGGSISPSGNVSVREGGDQTFTITPDKGYAVSNVKIDGKRIGAVKSYTFENVRRTHTIEVIFVKGTASASTGDSSNLPLWSALLLASTITLASAVHYKRKHAR